MFNPRWNRARAHAPRIMFSQMPAPSPGRSTVSLPSTRGGPKCYTAPDKGACYKCCAENSKTKAGHQQCLNQCVSLPSPKPQGAAVVPARMRNAAAKRRASRMARSRIRRARRRGKVTTLGAEDITWRCYNGVCRPEDLKSGACIEGTRKGIPSCCCNTVIV